jgi:hypothetical protein
MTRKPDLALSCSYGEFVDDLKAMLGKDRKRVEVRVVSTPDEKRVTVTLRGKEVGRWIGWPDDSSGSGVFWRVRAPWKGRYP